jgi:hypothetical protein
MRTVAPKNFLTELRRRNVIRMAGLYLVGAWLVVQVAGTVLPMFGAPEWLPRTIVVLLAIGFVPAVVRPRLNRRCSWAERPGLWTKAAGQSRSCQWKKISSTASSSFNIFAIIAAWAGDKELALQQLETGLRAPAVSYALSYNALKPHPFWDPLRGDPRFEKIVESLAPKDN